jgi:redox-sensitive bicupin YhaK (pirin superfamily)
MITVVDAKKLPGHVGSSALAAPVGPDDAPRTVGPFAVVVHATIHATGPGELPVDVDVRPHPHIGLIAISYVLEGAVTHRDSLGFRRELHAGDLGATISGRGVVHSERLERKRVLGGAFQMMQLLLALPDGAEEVEPSFVFRAKSEIPTTSADGATVHWLCASPPEVPAGLATTTPILLAAIDFEANGRWLPPEAPERALYVRSGAIEVGDARVGEGRVAILAPGATRVRALEPSHVIEIGGTTVAERYKWL